jgi:hypothetical protein
MSGSPLDSLLLEEGTSCLTTGRKTFEKLKENIYIVGP